MPRQAIQTHAKAIGVPNLLHFTRAVNLPSIMTHGLYPIARIAEIGATPAVNDELRLDGHRDSTSLSIGFPNSRMFYKYRQDNPGVDWVVLGIHPKVLWTKECAFCRHNAADARISRQDLATLKTAEAFAGVFDEIEGNDSRQQQKLRAYDPTDVQAEVLVFDVVEPDLVIGAVFETEAVKHAHAGHLGTRQILVNSPNKGYFAARSYVR